MLCSNMEWAPQFPLFMILYNAYIMLFNLLKDWPFTDISPLRKVAIAVYDSTVIIIMKTLQRNLQ